MISQGTIKKVDLDNAAITVTCKGRDFTSSVATSGGYSPSFTEGQTVLLAFVDGRDSDPVLVGTIQNLEKYTEVLDSTTGAFIKLDDAGVTVTTDKDTHITSTLSVDKEASLNDNLNVEKDTIIKGMLSVQAGSSLLTVLNSLIDTVIGLVTVGTPVTQSLNPATIAALNKVKADLALVLK